MKRFALYTAGFIFMTLLAAIDFVLFVDRLVSLRGRGMLFIVSLPIVILGGYVGWTAGEEMGFDREDVINMSALISITSGMLLMLLFLL